MRFVVIMLEAVVRILRSYFEQRKVWNDSDLRSLVLDEIEMLREELSEPEITSEGSEQPVDVVQNYADGRYDVFVAEQSNKYGDYCCLNVVFDEIVIDEPRKKAPVFHGFFHVVGGEYDGQKVEHVLFLGKGNQNRQVASFLNNRLNFKGNVSLKSLDERKLCVRRVNRKLPGLYVYTAKFYPTRNGKRYPYLEIEGYTEIVNNESGIVSQISTV